MNTSVYSQPSQTSAIYIGVEDMILTDAFYESLDVYKAEIAKREAYRRLFIVLLNRALANQATVMGPNDSAKKVQARVEQATRSIQDQFYERIANSFWCIEWHRTGKAETYDEFAGVLQLRLRTGEVVDLDTLHFAIANRRRHSFWRTKLRQVTEELCRCWRIKPQNVEFRYSAGAGMLSLMLDES